MRNYIYRIDTELLKSYIIVNCGNGYKIALLTDTEKGHYEIISDRYNKLGNASNAIKRLAKRPWIYYHATKNIIDSHLIVGY